MPPTTVRAAALAAALLSLSLSACGKKDGEEFTPPPTEVGIVIVEEHPVPVDLTYMARTAGVREVEVRARVGGILQRRRYEEGSRVRQGDLLFRIDPATYEAEVAHARAQLGAENARLQEARRERDRIAPLLSQGLVSRRDHDQAMAAFEAAEAAVAGAEAFLKRAELDLSYTEVRAPISGLTSLERRSEGSLISMDGDSNLLTRIVQTDPLYIEFAMPASEAALVRGALGKEGVHVVAVMADGQALAQTAALTFVDAAVDQNSGTVQARATLPNKEGKVLPGQFLRARIAGVTLPSAAMVPSRAVLRSPMGTMVWVVGEGDKVQARPVQLGDSIGNDVTVLSGLQAGERVIVDGIIKVQPEAVVKPVISGSEQEQQAPQQPAQQPDQPPAGH